MCTWRSPQWFVYMRTCPGSESCFSFSSHLNVDLRAWSFSKILWSLYLIISVLIICHSVLGHLNSRGNSKISLLYHPTRVKCFEVSILRISFAFISVCFVGLAVGTSEVHCKLPALKMSHCVSEFNEPASWQGASSAFLWQREEVGADLWSGGQW